MMIHTQQKNMWVYVIVNAVQWGTIKFSVDLQDFIPVACSNLLIVKRVAYILLPGMFWIYCNYETGR